MITKYFKCKLLSDVVINSSLATEGNMESLDYIPGSNFLGVVATDYDKDKAYDIFHSGKVSFGDALISIDKGMSYSVPFSLYAEKLKTDITKDKIWVHHKLDELESPKDTAGNKLQLKQVRSGYINLNNDYIKNIEKEFALKSAYDPKERRSKESAMFGFEALKKGQDFVFSVIFSDDAEKHIDFVTDKLTNDLVHIGKSKTAQYGLAEITEMNDVATFNNGEIHNDYLIVYAESNLCFLNEYGQSTFQPKASDFGAEGDIIWKKSQIRTYSYSPWNEKRKATSTQRDVILKGSVIVIKLEKQSGSLPCLEGEYNAEGMGRVIFNPEFLKYDNKGEWDFKVNKFEPKKEKPEKTEIKSPLAKLLNIKRNALNNEKEIGEKVIDALKSEKYKALRNIDITNSQWGAIRQAASLSKDMKELNKKLFEKEKGYLMHGVAAEKIWDKYRGKRRYQLKALIEDDDHASLGPDFIAVFASEIVKKNRNDKK